MVPYSTQSVFWSLFVFTTFLVTLMLIINKIFPPGVLFLLLLSIIGNYWMGYYRCRDIYIARDEIKGPL